MMRTTSLRAWPSPEVAKGRAGLRVSRSAARCTLLAAVPVVLAAALIPRLAPASEPVWPRGVFLSEQRLATLQARIAAGAQPTADAYARVRRDAERQLDRRPHAPATWYVPDFYRNAEGHRAAKLGLQDDANAAYLLALVYRMEGDERFARSAARLIDGWPAGVRTASRKDDSALSFCYHFSAMIFAADLLRQWDGWPAARQAAFRRFLKETALPLSTMDRPNNWGSWGVVLTVAAAAHLGDRPLFDGGVARWRQLIGSQIAADGHLVHEVRRNGGRSGLWYSHFSLLPQTIAAEIARVNGVDLFEYRAPNGRSLRLAFERLAPWADRPETFPYWKGSPGELHGAGYAAYFEILAAHWPDADATAVLERSRPLGAHHAAPALTFTHGGVLHDDGR